MGCLFRQNECFVFPRHLVASPPGETRRGRRGLVLSASSSQKSNSLEKEIAQMERQVIASAQEKMDYNQITRALSEMDASPSPSSTIESWQVALTASTVTSGASLFLFSNLYVSLFVFVTIFVVANNDPMQDDSLLGALARVLGRATLKSYETNKPKMQALARAVVTGQDEVRELKEELDALQMQTNELSEWKARRLFVEENLNKFTVDDLKQRARDNQLPVGGTKMQLLQRLVDTNVIDIR